MAKQRKTTKKSETIQPGWFFATNLENLKNIIAQGLVTSPEGFIKYYSDSLELFPGYVPLFRESIPKLIFDKSLVEDKNLILCIIEFSLENVSGNIKAISNSTLEKEGLFDNENTEQNNIIDISLDKIRSENSIIKTIFVPTPLPTSSIKSIIFSKKEDKSNFEKEAAIFSNLPLVDLDLKIDSTKFFNNASDSLAGIKLPKNSTCSYSLIQAYGGMLALSFYFAKNGKPSNQMYHTISRFGGIEEIKNENVNAIYDYFRQENDDDYILKKVYEGLIDILISGKDKKNEIVNYLEKFEDIKFKKRLSEIAKTLRDFESLNTKSISILFREAKSPLEKVLLMLFVREDGSDLIDYYLQDLSESDYFIFALLFGIRDKFIKSPKFIREFNNLQKFITSSMANYAHTMFNSELKFETAKYEPPTMIDLFENKKFLEKFIKKNSINCLETIIKIPTGDYKLSVLSSGVEIFFEGEPKNITTNISENRLYSFMLQFKLDDYNQLLKL